MKKIRVVAIGQVPPPVTGQAVMIRMMVDATYPNIEVFHVPMVLSRDVASQGSFAFEKITRLVQVPVKAIYYRFRYGALVLYYPPSGPVKLAVIRDIFVLLLTRPFFSRTVLHFHAGGMSQIYPTLPRLIQWCYRKALFHPDIIIRISTSSPSELEHLKGRREMLLPNGIHDPAGDLYVRPAGSHTSIHILFVGHLIEGKGILVLLEAFADLLARGLDVRLTCVGGWGDEDVRTRAQEFVRTKNMEERISFPGQLLGEAKLARFREADIFCFPSFFHSEVFPLVLLEAMAFALPIVTTRWRGIPDLVAEDQNALLVPTQDPKACAEALAILILNPELRTKLGRESRARFLANFRSDVHLASIERIFLTAAGL